MPLSLKQRFEYIRYTFSHKIAFLRLEKETLGRVSWRGICHDMDKIFFYLFSRKAKNEIQKIHRSKSRHHVENNIKKSRDDLIEMMLDFECARMTKPDKPLNCYETVNAYYPHMKADLYPLIALYFPQHMRETHQDSV